MPIAGASLKKKAFHCAINTFVFHSRLDVRADAIREKWKVIEIAKREWLTHAHENLKIFPKNTRLQVSKLHNIGEEKKQSGKNR